MRQTITWIYCAVFLAACGGAEGDAQTLQNQLNQGFGGLTEEAEAPSFGDVSRFADIEADAAEILPSGDPIGAATNADADVALAEVEGHGPTDRPRPNVYGVRISWGRHDANPDAETATLWDPTIRTDCGYIAAKRRLRLEEGEGVVRPRDSRQSLDVISSTRPATDGLLVALVIPPNEACAETISLSFSSATALPQALRVDLTPALSAEIVSVELGDGLAVRAEATRAQKPVPGCLHGRLRGRWILATQDDGSVGPNGRFYGRFSGPFGRGRGHVRGIFGIPESGEHAGEMRFFGKMISRNGRFEGLMAGDYGDGSFAGGWYLRPHHRALHGRVAGTYDATEQDPEMGHFSGMYASETCVQNGLENPVEDPASAGDTL